jgi:hypothetical protein
MLTAPQSRLGWAKTSSLAEQLFATLLPPGPHSPCAHWQTLPQVLAMQILPKQRVARLPTWRVLRQKRSMPYRSAPAG